MLSGCFEDDRKLFPWQKWMDDLPSSPQHCLLAKERVVQHVQKLEITQRMNFHSGFTSTLSQITPIRNIAAYVRRKYLPCIFGRPANFFH
jgi:hypothetical protein